MPPKTSPKALCCFGRRPVAFEKGGVFLASIHNITEYRLSVRISSVRLLFKRAVRIHSTAQTAIGGSCGKHQMLPEGEWCMMIYASRRMPCGRSAMIVEEECVHPI